MIKLQSVIDSNKQTDPWEIFLETNVATEIFKRKEGNLQELNMLQNCEEAKYFESMTDMME